MLAACAPHRPAAAPVPTAPPTDDPDRLLATLTTRQKVAQLVMPWIGGGYAPFDDAAFAKATGWVDSLEVGGIIVSIGSPHDVAAKLNALQRRARLPLLVASDLESGSAFRLTGGTPFPSNMGVGATGRDRDAWEMGRITALEGRAVGIHLAFAPVADVNSNPANPIINTRSFGEDPRAVARFVAAEVHGLEAHGMPATVKHFPGHGDTETDSHLALPLVGAGWDRLDSLELVPFRAAIAAGVTAVMSAHLAVPRVTGDSARPGTLQPAVLTGLLRDSLGFRGLAVTDALDMGAIVRSVGAGEAVVQAFLAGADLLLQPADPAVAIDAMVAAVESGRVSPARLDASVRKVLALKRRVGLFRARTVPLDSVMTVVGRQEFQAVARDVARRAVVLAEDRQGVVDSLRARRGRRAVLLYGDETQGSAGNALVQELRARGDTVTTFRLFPASGPASYDSARAVLARAPAVVASVAVRASAWRGSIGIPPALVALVDSVARAKPLVLVSLGSPYVRQGMPNVGSYLLAWAANATTEWAAAGALTGAAITGHLPVRIPPDLPLGAGLERPALATPAAVDWRPAAEALDSAIAAGAAPGAVLAVSVAHRRWYHGTGVLGDSLPVAPDSLTRYDLASLTKVVGLTTAVMLGVSEGRLDLAAPVRRYVPAFRGGGRERVTLRQLLLHESGLPAWRPLYKDAATRAAALALVDTTALDTLPGARFTYSDLGAIALTQAVEAAFGTRLDTLLASRVFPALGMTRTGYLPAPDSASPIAPTERDPWRGRMLQGEVHDENAARLDGVSGHAGLFSDAQDLLAFGEWLVDAWWAAGAPPATRGDRAPGAATALPIPPALVREFTAAQDEPAGSSRALGWDTPSAPSSAGTRFSALSFGHTGFTGTSLWVDPTRRLVLVLLSNRVHPTRDNPRWHPVRALVADRVASAVDASGGR